MASFSRRGPGDSFSLLLLLLLVLVSLGQAAVCTTQPLCIITGTVVYDTQTFSSDVTITGSTTTAADSILKPADNNTVLFTVQNGAVLTLSHVSLWGPAASIAVLLLDTASLVIDNVHLPFVGGAVGAGVVFQVDGTLNSVQVNALTIGNRNGLATFYLNANGTTFTATNVVSTGSQETFLVSGSSTPLTDISISVTQSTFQNGVASVITTGTECNVATFVAPLVVNFHDVRAAVSMSSCTFSQNSGNLFTFDDSLAPSTVLISNSLFHNNTGSGSQSMFIITSGTLNLTVVDSNVTSSRYTSGTANFLHVQNLVASRVELTNMVFTKNTFTRPIFYFWASGTGSTQTVDVVVTTVYVADTTCTACDATGFMFYASGTGSMNRGSFFMTGTTFVNNTSNGGASFHLYSSTGNGNQLSSAKFLSSNFINSVALASSTVSSTAVASGISFYFGNALELVLDKCVFTNNRGNRYGALYLGRANFASARITNTVMTSNSQTYGAVTLDNNVVNLVIDNVVAHGNIGTGGGGFSELFNSDVVMTVTNSIFTSNSASSNLGGGFYYTCTTSCSTGPVLSFTNVTFEKNTGSTGAAIALANSATSGGTISFVDVTFKDNTASTGDGGALYIGQGNYTLTLSGTTSFTGNKATQGNGGGAAIFRINPISLSNLSFTKNTAGKSGGAIYLSGSNGAVSLTGLTFTNNTASNSGGALSFGSISLALTQSSFSGNLSPSGSAVYTTGLQSNTNLSNLNFTRNGATSTASQGALFVGPTSGLVSLTDLTFTSNSDAFYSIGSHTGSGVQASNWVVTGTGNPYVDLSGLGAPLIALSGYTGTFSLSNSAISNNVNPKGSVFSVAGGTLSVSNVQVVDNTASVVVASVNSAVTLTNCNISGNTAVDSSAVVQSLVAVSQAASVTATGSLISGNTAEILWSHSSTGSSSLQGTNLTTNSYTTTLLEISQGSLSMNGALLQQTGLPDQSGPCFTATNAAILSLAGTTITSCRSTRGPAILWARDFTSFTLTGSTISGADAPAAAIKITDSSTAQISSCTFSQCSSGILAFQGNVAANVIDCDLLDSESSSIDPTFVHLSEGAAVTVADSRFRNGVSDYNPCMKVENSLLTMSNSSFTGCQNAQTGGAIHFTGTASSTIQTTTFDSNVAGIGGGALSFLQLVDTTILFESCTFIGNSANMGGVFSSYMAPGSSITFTDAEFSDNEASQFGGVFYASDSSTLSMADSTFTNNQARDGGIGYGDWYAAITLASSTIHTSAATHNGGSFVLDKYSRLTLSGSSISQSSSPSGEGGAIYMTVSSILVVDNSNFTSNSAGLTGGAIGVSVANQCEVNVTASTFTLNTAEEGGAIFFGPTLENKFFVVSSTFKNNSADLGGAIAGESSVFPTLEDVVYANNVATTFGDDVYGRPESLVLDSQHFSLSLLSGETLPDLEVGLYDFRGVRYTLEPKPQFLVYLTGSNASLIGELSASFEEGKVTFSKVRVIGNAGIHTLTIGPSTSDTFYNHAQYAISLQVTINPCTGRNFQSVDGTCNLITCNGCPVDSGATCVSPGNCSCPAGKEGLQCQLPTDAYDSIFLKFAVLPAPPGLLSGDINVETRDYLLAQLALAYDGAVSVVYCAFYAEVKKTRDESTSYVLKYSLTQDGKYLEQEALAEYQLTATSYFSEMHEGSDPAATVNLVEVNHLEASDPLVVTVTVITAVLLALTVATMVMVWLKRDTPVIKSASPLFCQMMLTGIILAYLTFVPYIGPPTRLSCMAPVVMGSLSFSIIFGNLLAKTFRIYRIFSNRRMRVVAPSNKLLLVFTLAIVTIEMIIVAIWLGVDPPVPFRTGSEADRFETCYSDLDHTMVAILMAYNGVLLLFGVFLAFKTRKAYSAFRESQLIGFTIYTLTIFTAAVLPVLFGVELDLNTQFAIRSFAVILVTTATLGFLFGSKMLIIVFQPEKNSSEFLREENKSGSFHGLNMKRMDKSSDVSSSVDLMNMASKVSGHIMVCEDKPWSQWKRKHAILYGDYFGFFEDENHFDEKGGLHPLSLWQVSEINQEDCKMKISNGRRTYIVDAANPQDLQKWFDLLRPKTMPTASSSSKEFL